MFEKRKKSDYILLVGAAVLILTATFAILILVGAITPNIFPTSGELLDVNPLSSGLVTFLMLIILLYVATRILDFGLKYRREENEPKEPR
ncbi:MAG: hypothetical protein ACFFD2_30490 [Promethearchaeota archaeon]